MKKLLLTLLVSATPLLSYANCDMEYQGGQFMSVTIHNMVAECDYSNGRSYTVPGVKPVGIWWYKLNNDTYSCGGAFADQCDFA